MKQQRPASNTEPSRKDHILMVVENHFPADMRVRKEAHVLRDIFNVSVVALHRENEKYVETVDGIRIYRLPSLNLLPAGKLKYALDYLLITFGGLLVLLTTFPRYRYKFIHAHNPPDTLFIIGLFGKLLGARFVFDHHDLSPELYLTRFGGRKDIIYKTLLIFERWSCKLADFQISTNETYRHLVVDRHNIDPAKIHIVRNDPTHGDFIWEKSPVKKIEGKYILIFMGMVNPQDGMDVMCEIIRDIVDMGRKDVLCRVLGHGDSLNEVKEYAVKLGVEEHFDFRGFIRDKKEIQQLLATSHIGVEPAPDNPLNSRSTFIKIMEYMASGRPIVAFDLPETRFSANGAALLVEPGDKKSFAEAIVRLLDDPDLRLQLGKAGDDRINKTLNWDNASKSLLHAYQASILTDKPDRK